MTRDMFSSSPKLNVFEMGGISIPEVCRLDHAHPITHWPARTGLVFKMTGLDLRIGANKKRVSSELILLTSSRSGCISV